MKRIYIAVAALLLVSAAEFYAKQQADSIKAAQKNKDTVTLGKLLPSICSRVNNPQA